MFGLSAQARRAAYSVSLNIAEGVGKRGSRELRRYLDIALGSLFELEVILRFAKDLEFSPANEIRELEELRSKAPCRPDASPPVFSRVVVFHI
jgi:four helix bundle protein